MIKVAMIVRSTFNVSKGGDTIQVLQTAAHLAQYNISADIKLTNEKIDYSKYDLLHFFNITRPADILYHIHKAKKPFFVSPILIDYSEYDKYHRKGLAGILFRYLNADSIEYIKTISRWVLGKDKLMSIDYLWKGQRRTIMEILKQAAILLPNSHSEYNRLLQHYNCSTDYMVVPNGVDTGMFSFNNAIKKDPKLVLCVARVEGLKNQVNLIRALNNTNFNLIIIGAEASNQSSYYNSCREIATKNIRFIEHLPQQELVSYYQKAKVHVLPSWFETTGLSSLEAAVMGCSIVITDKGDAREYFGSDASYCDPASPQSIYNTVEKAAALPYNISLRQKILTQYSWQQATIRTIEAYKKVINIWD
jgi:glycosyltransferase involved in cell wall biosynthesis